MKDSNFYNAESLKYSSKRYPDKANTFTQFFFKERLRITLSVLQQLLNGRRNVSLLEIGCADGIIIRRVWETFSNYFGRIEATDVAEEMITQATQKNTHTPIHFFRRETQLPGNNDIILEIGVLNLISVQDECKAVAEALHHFGYFICSLSGASSLQHRLKGQDRLAHLESYQVYERILGEHFNLLRSEPIGFFIPWLWKIPQLGRVLQPFVEWVGKHIAPNLAHEKLYVLTPKS